MNRIEFMQQLEMLLADISEAERADAIKYYNDYFDDAGIENEAGVIEQLGSPEQVAQNIKADAFGTENVNQTYTNQDAPNMNYTYSSQDAPNMNHTYTSQDAPNMNHTYTNQQPQNNDRDGATLALVVVLIIVTFPLWMSLAGALIGIAFGLTVGGGGIMVGGIAVIGAAIAKTAIFPMGGVFLFGLSFLLLALGLVFIVGGLSIGFVAIPAIIKGVTSLIKKALGKKGEV
ncbi:MAG: DUF1700 domain-containing protein [Lachnospiraceae bacterium]|nr:DUF1700 domain-containing protein [Lachnospiraceae bacterium]MBR3683975.1 DUF1700 domain-containing protein [Lachnospiraceae bacterium]